MTVIYNAKIAKAMIGGDIDTSKFAASIAYYKATTAIQLKNEDGEALFLSHCHSVTGFL